jgi:uncharacterized Zn-finger protein
MAPDTTCPTCGTKFEARQHRVFANVLSEALLTPPRLTVNARLDDSARVICPRCKTEFVSDGMRYFGFLSRGAMHKLIAGFVLALVIVFAYFELVK